MKYIFLIIIFFVSNCYYTQSNLKSDYDFIYHLITNNRINHSLYYLNHIKPDISEDSINFLKGYTYYLLKKPDSSAFFFSKVQNNHLQTKSQILASLNYAYANELSQSIQYAHLIPSDTINSETLIIKKFLLAGNYLLQNQFDSSNYYLKSVNPIINYKYQNIYTNMNMLFEKQKKFKQKSPFIAMLMSAFVPGSGKLYAGRKGEAMSMFVANIIFAGFTLEAYYRSHSFKSPTLIVFGSLFTFFYTGNIIGSYHAVKRQNLSRQKQIKNEILATMHSATSNILD